MRNILAAAALLWSSSALGQGVIPLALAQQININGMPLSGALLYIYQVGTVATPQNSFQDFGLTLPNPWPLQADSTGRIPMFYLANGQVHVRLTDASGVVVLDYPTMQVVGPSSGGGGGGGGTVDPTAIASTGDVKFRATSEVLTGWVKLNGQTIGSATSGASGRANADTQNLFVHLWQNCPNMHCSVSGGRGASAGADFGANKTITLLDWRSRTAVGLDDMGAAAAGRMLATNVTSGAGDGVTTPNATGGEANHVLSIAELANHNHALTDPGHKHIITPMRATAQAASGGGSANLYSPSAPITSQSTDLGAGTFGGDVNGTGITIANTGAGNAHNTMMPFMLGTWYQKL